MNLGEKVLFIVKFIIFSDWNNKCSENWWISKWCDRFIESDSRDFNFFGIVSPRDSSKLANTIFWNWGSAYSFQTNFCRNEILWYNVIYFRNFCECWNFKTFESKSVALVFYLKNVYFWLTKNLDFFQKCSKFRSYKKKISWNATQNLMPEISQIVYVKTRITPYA